MPVKMVRIPQPVRWQLPSPPDKVTPSVTSAPAAASPAGPTLADVMRGIHDLKNEIEKIKSEISNIKKNQGKILDGLNTITQRQWTTVQFEQMCFLAIEQYIETAAPRTTTVVVQDFIVEGQNYIQTAPWTTA